tara:strand:- start:2157 stop:2483 length:327 start_codon:yes stop_codon:yes gene_type:complete
MSKLYVVTIKTTNNSKNTEQFEIISTRMSNKPDQTIIDVWIKHYNECHDNNNENPEYGVFCCDDTPANKSFADACYWDLLGHNMNLPIGRFVQGEIIFPNPPPNWNPC